MSDALAVDAVAQPAIEASVEPAGFLIRGAARLIDWIPLWIGAAVAAAILGAGAVWVPRSNLRNSLQLMQDSKILQQLAWLVGMVLYHTFSESVGGASAGKRIFGLEVVGEDLRPATLRQTLKRSVGFFVDGLFFGLVGYGRMKDSPARQRIGDAWGKTRVVKRRSLPAGERRTTTIWLFAALAAIGIEAEGIALLAIAYTAAFG